MIGFCNWLPIYNFQFLKKNLTIFVGFILFVVAVHMLQCAPKMEKKQWFHEIFQKLKGTFYYFFFLRSTADPFQFRLKNTLNLGPNHV